MMTDLDTLIDEQHRAAERAEERAVQVHARLRLVPGLDSWLSRHKRSYGTAANPWRDGNLTAQGLIQRSDPALAHFLAREAGKSILAPDYNADAARERRNAEARAMEKATEVMRQRNAARRAQRQQEQQWGRWDAFQGKRIYS